jgi:hypothetical protein
MSEQSETISSDVDFDSLAAPETAEKEEVWCKISPDGGLEHFDWDFVEKTAKEFDTLSPAVPKNNAQIICKLAVLIREQTLQRAASLINRYAEVPAESSVVMIKDPLGDDL